MRQYSVTKEDLIQLANELFESGYAGYLDLKELTCESAIEIFLSNKSNLLLNSNPNLQYRSSTSDTTYLLPTNINNNILIPDSYNLNSLNISNIYSVNSNSTLHS